jgi:hypothetical protein
MTAEPLHVRQRKAQEREALTRAIVSKALGGGKGSVAAAALLFRISDFVSGRKKPAKAGRPVGS